MATDPRLTRLRVELYTAAQSLTGEDAREFWALVEEVQAIRQPLATLHATEKAAGVPGLWSNDPQTAEGKYPIVLRRDGTVLTTPYLVITLRDPCAAAALAAYADEAFSRNLHPQYVADIRALADRSMEIAAETPGDPDAPRHRRDDPHTIAWARSVHGHKPASA